MRRSLGKMSKRSRALGRSKRKLTIPALISGYSVGEIVSIDSQSKYSGMPHPRYRGRTGIITAKRGNAYVVRINDGKMPKELVIPPVHLRKVGKKGSG
ncbi:MAG: 50S ribosomal protein L21e [Candidatus Micrarchaeota archaeon]|nr:50S ribosomal protein L21e [Candidatus Micrarchaeota archaeon]